MREVTQFLLLDSLMHASLIRDRVQGREKSKKSFVRFRRALNQLINTLEESPPCFQPLKLLRLMVSCSHYLGDRAQDDSFVRQFDFAPFSIRIDEHLAAEEFGAEHEPDCGCGCDGDCDEDEEESGLYAEPDWRGDAVNDGVAEEFLESDDDDEGVSAFQILVTDLNADLRCFLTAYGYTLPQHAV